MIKHIEPHRFYSPAQLVSIGLASKSTLAIWRMQGKGIPYSKVGHMIKYAGIDVISYLEANKVKPTPVA